MNNTLLCILFLNVFACLSAQSDLEIVKQKNQDHSVDVWLANTSQESYDVDVNLDLENMKTNESYAFMSVLIIFSLVYLFIREQYKTFFEYVLIGLMEIFVFMLIYRIFKVVNFQQFFDLKKYRNQALKKDDLSQLARNLEEVMSNEKLYLDNTLSLSILAERIQTNSNGLSQLFNLYYNSNFYEFVNRYRIEHLEKLILDPSYDHFKIIALAEQSGFKSKTTFYKAFKQKHQITPLQFVKLYKK